MEVSNIFFDLHVHSTMSDGVKSPEALVRMAKKKGLLVMSVTDHDTIDGVMELISAGKKHKQRTLAGVEISAEFPTTMHILGYGFDPENTELNKTLTELQLHRASRNEEITENLRKLGVDITLKEVSEKAGGEVVGRPHFALVMLEKRYVSCMKEAFDKYLQRGAPGYAPRKRLSPEESLNLIRNAGGIPVLAHPPQLNMNFSELAALVSDLKSMGLGGMECFSPHFTNEDSEVFVEIAKTLHLTITGGSDYHGNGHGSTLGVRAPDGAVDWGRLGLWL